MIPPLDIFQVNGSEAVWLGTAESLLEALELARRKGTGSYMIFSHQTGHKTTYQVDAGGKIQPMTPTEKKAANA